MNHRRRGAAHRRPTVALPAIQRWGRVQREVQRPGTSKAPEIPPWVRNLLEVVNYNFSKDLASFCVSCEKGLYRERDFEEGESHHGHKWVRMYQCESSICVNSLDMKNLNVDIAEIQEFKSLDPGVDPPVFLFLNNAFGYTNDPRNDPTADLPWMRCCQCTTKLNIEPLGLMTTRFCCLECQIGFLSRVKVENGKLSPRIVPREQLRPPPYESHLRDVSFAKMLRRDHGSTSRTLENNVQYSAGNDVSSQHGPEQCHDLDAAAVDEILDPLDPRDERKSTRKSTQQYGLETGFEEEISPLRRSDSDFKVESVSEAQVVFPGTPPADGSEYRQATLQREHGAAEQRCSAGADSSESWYATVHELRHAGGPLSADIDHSPNEREMNQICLPEDLYEDQLHVLLTPRAEILSSMHITAPPGSPTSSPEGLNAKLHSYANSNPVETPNRVHPECASGLTPNLFRKALAAASCSSNNKWRRTPKTNAMTKGDGDLDGEGMGTMEGLHPMPKSLEDNISRKAALVLCSVRSEFENSYYAINEEDTTSIQSSSSPGGQVRPQFSNSPPKVHKVPGPIDFKSLKQLASTFDPLRWIKEVRCPGKVLNLPAVPGHAL